MKFNSIEEYNEYLKKKETAKVASPRPKKNTKKEEK
jgi:hypothetical protein